MPSPGLSGRPAPRHDRAEGAPGRVLLVRHGETEWSASGQHTSRTDVALTARGENQARALAPVLAGELAGRPPALVLTSPLQRASRTAELLGLAARIDPDLREVDYGEYEGLTTPQIREYAPGWTVWTGTLPGGEKLTEVAERVDRLLDRVRAALPAGDVILVGHGHLLRILAARWLDQPPEAGRFFALDTATLSVLGTEHDSPVLRRWNLPDPAEKE